MTPAEQMRESIASLDAALKAAHPQMATLLQDIHKRLKADSALVPVLTEEEVAVICVGLSKQTGVQLVAAMTGKKGSGNGTTGKALKKLDLGDL